MAQIPRLATPASSVEQRFRSRSYGEFSSYPLLVCYLVLLVGIPSELVFSPLGAAGTPAGVLSIGMMLFWVLGLAATIESRLVDNPIKWVLFAFAVAILISYIVGMSRPVSTTVEVNSADRALLALCGWLGISLVIIDGVRSREMIDKMLRLLVYGAAFIATLGVLQFFFNLDLAHLIKIPGLTANSSFGELIARSSFRRVTGTASHPIEFGVVLSSVLPIGVHYARFATDIGVRTRLWMATLIIAAALPLSVARSGILGFAIALGVMFFTWPRSFRLKTLAALIAGLAALSVVVPGLIGTFRGLFLNAATDPSTGGRTDDYGPVVHYVAEAPLFGRGFGTFIPSLYRTLDNAYLGLLVETGIVGVVAMVSLIVGAVIVALRFRRLESSLEGKDLGQTMVAAVAVLGVNAFTFDLFGFSMCAGVLFLLLGAIGALHALQHTDERVSLRPSTTRVKIAIGILALAVAGVSIVTAKFTPPEWQAKGSVILVPPSPASTPALTTVGRAATATSLLRDMISSESSRDALSARGVPDFDVAIGDGSLMTGTDREGTGGSVLAILVRSSSGRAADEGLRAVEASLTSHLAALRKMSVFQAPNVFVLTRWVTILPTMYADVLRAEQPGDCCSQSYLVPPPCICSVEGVPPSLS